MSLFSALHLFQNTRHSLLANVAKISNGHHALRFSTAQVLRNTTTNSEKPRIPDTAEARWSEAARLFASRKKIMPQDAYSGRSVVVSGGDVAGASKFLDRILAHNNVIREWRMSFRHRQKGEERRKLKSTRWRKRFKYEVSKKVELVQQIRRRGS